MSADCSGDVEASEARGVGFADGCGERFATHDFEAWEGDGGTEASEDGSS